MCCKCFRGLGEGRERAREREGMRSEKGVLQAHKRKCILELIIVENVVLSFLFPLSRSLCVIKQWWCRCLLALFIYFFTHCCLVFHKNSKDKHQTTHLFPMWAVLHCYYIEKKSFTRKYCTALFF